MTMAACLSCSSGGAGVSPDTGGAPSAVNPTSRSGSTTSAPPAGHPFDDDESSAIEAALRWGFQDRAAELAEVEGLNNLYAARDEYVAQCMRNEGFDYVAIDASIQVELIEDPDIEPDSPGFVRRYGLGITTLSFPVDAVGPDGVGFEWDWFAIQDDDDGGPNEVYRRSLDEAGQRAYSKTYGGDDGLSGCVGEADEALPNRAEQIRISLVDQLEDLDERVKASAGYRQLTAEVDDCMGVESHTFTGFDDISDQLDQMLIDRGVVADLIPVEGEVEVVIDGEAPTGELVYGSEEWIAALVEVQQFELLLAKEFERCIGEREWFRRLAEVAEPFRADFMVQHQAQLGSVLFDG